MLLISSLIFLPLSLVPGPASVKRGSGVPTFSARAWDWRVRGWAPSGQVLRRQHVSLYRLCACPGWCYTGVVSTVGMVFISSFLCSWTFYLHFIHVLDGSAGLWWRESTRDDHPDHVFKIETWMKQGLLSASFLPSPSGLLRVRTSWGVLYRVFERLEYRQEFNKLSKHFHLSHPYLLYCCSVVKYDLPSTSVHPWTICYFDTVRHHRPPPKFW
jgi:hypothetical protein